MLKRMSFAGGLLSRTLSPLLKVSATYPENTLYSSGVKSAAGAIGLRARLQPLKPATTSDRRAIASVLRTTPNYAAGRGLTKTDRYTQNPLLREPATIFAQKLLGSANSEWSSAIASSLGMVSAGSASPATSPVNLIVLPKQLDSRTVEQTPIAAWPLARQRWTGLRSGSTVRSHFRAAFPAEKGAVTQSIRRLFVDSRSAHFVV
jgi:hypothetical protein